MLMPSVLQPLHSWKKKYHCEYNTFLIYLTTSKRGGGGVAVLSVKSCWLMLMPSVLQPLHSWKKKYHCEYNTFLIYLTTSKRGGGGGGSFISKVLLANADALCAAASPLMEEEIPL